MPLKMHIAPGAGTPAHTAQVAAGNMVQALKNLGPRSSLQKADAELQIVWAEVYVPNIPDSQGDFMSAETIREMAYTFLKNNYLTHVDVNHNNVLSGASVVESFIAREGDPDFVPHSWVVGVHVPDPALWEDIKTGKLNGFSLEGMSMKEQKTVVMNIPDKMIVAAQYQFI